MNKNRNFTKAALLGALLCGVVTPSFVGCSDDYDDDIKGLQEQIDAVKTGSIAKIDEQLKGLLKTQTDLTDADKSINAAIKALEGTKDAYKAADEVLKGLINSKVDQTAIDKAVKSLEAKDAELAEKLKGLDAKDAELTEKLKGFDAKDAELAESLKGLDAKNAELTEKLKGLDDKADKTAVEDITKRIAAIEEMKAEIIKHITAIEEINAEIIGRIAAVEGSLLTMDQVKAEIKTSAEALTKQISDLDVIVKANAGKILSQEETNKTLTEETKKNLELINGLQSALDTYKGTIDALIQEKIDTSLEASTQAITTKFQKITDDLSTTLSESLTAAFKEADGDLLAKINVNKDAIAAQVKALEELQKGSIATHTEGIKELNLKLNGDGTDANPGLITLAKNAKAFIDEFDKNVNNLIEQALVVNNGKITTEIATAINTALTDFSTKKDGLNDQLNAITDRLGKLETRIQSLVFVPTYQGGTHPLYYIDDAVAKYAPVVLKFRVSPEKGATDIANTYKGDKTILSLLCEEELKTRATAQSFEISDVTAENGILTIKATSKDFGTSQRPVALRLNNNNDLTTSDYLVVKAEKFYNARISQKGGLSYNIPFDSKVIFDVIDTHYVMAKFEGEEQTLSTFGFTEKFVVTHIDNRDVNDAANKEAIETYLKGTCFELVNDGKVITIQIKKDKQESSYIGKGSLMLTLKDETTGSSSIITYNVGKAISDVNYVNYDLAIKEHLDERSAEESFLCPDNSFSKMYYLSKNLVDKITMTTIENLDDKLTELANATTVCEVMDDNGEWKPKNSRQPYLQVSNNEVKILVPSYAIWKNYTIRTIFTTDFGVYTIEAKLPLSYDIANIFALLPGQFKDGNFVIAYSPVKGTSMPFISINLNKKIYDNTYSRFNREFAIKQKNDKGDFINADPSDLSYTDGILTIKSGNVQPRIEASTKDKYTSQYVKNKNGENVEYFPVYINYPFTNEKFGKMENLTYKSTDIRKNIPFNPWASKTKSELTLTDVLGNQILTSEETGKGTGMFKVKVDPEWGKTYSIVNGVIFSIVGTDGTLKPTDFSIDKETGYIQLLSTTLTESMTITVRVSIEYLYGKISKDYTINIEAIN